ncbi:MAG: acetyl-CoA carboxylase biotin carboxylase subunit [Bacteroidia bacterium]|nr:MAG: acetyl-CoA carboxylase biotin carboxylase subunit [Bacteroidia bacterium]
MEKRIQKVLVANRGEIAVRVLRTCRDMGIRTVAVFADPDRSALHVQLADEAYALDGVTAAESYLDQNKILAIARKASVDAIHPGYGYLSENHTFAAEVEKAGIEFIGPPSRAIALLGEKTAARKLARSLGIPMVQGSADAFSKAEDALASVGDLRFPLLLKAAAGGGGKGMRIVHDRSEFASAFKMASSEARKAFGDPRVYVERYLVNPHHVEIQILGDKSGQVVYFPERDCSLQRRHQKLVEESPSPIVDSDLRDRMGKVAASLASAAGYFNAGTVEFLVDDKGEFYFLEVNTRLQVEHPVTEAVTGFDLVKEQILAAEGRPLSFRQEDIPLKGHAIECRIYAEDPANEFFPSTGRLSVFRPPSGPGVRVDTGAREGDSVDVYFDPLLAKVITHGSDRRESLQRMSRALQEFAVAGLHTTIPFCKYILETSIFVEAKHTTQLINKGVLQEFLNQSLDPILLDAAAVGSVLLASDQRTDGNIAGAGAQTAWRLRRKEQHR